MVNSSKLLVIIENFEEGLKTYWKQNTS